MKTKLYITLMLGALFTSCIKEVEIDIPGFEEQIVIDGRIETDYPPFVLISRSKNIYAPTDLDAYLNGYVSGAIVTVSNGATTVQLIEICSDNLPPGSEAIVAGILGVPESDLEDYHICGYTSLNPLIYGEIGKTYTLTVEVEGKRYTSETKIMQPTALNSLFWKPEGNLSTHGFAWANLSDPPGQYDAYKWEVQRINKNANGDPIDPNFIEPFAPVFDDHFFDGMTFDFFYDNPRGYKENVYDEFAGLYPLGDTLLIKFSKMDRFVYEFMEKKYIQIATAQNPFATPTNIPTNIVGGALGVWAGYSPTFDTLICQP